MCKFSHDTESEVLAVTRWQGEQRKGVDGLFEKVSF